MCQPSLVFGILNVKVKIATCGKMSSVPVRIESAVDKPTAGSSRQVPHVWARGWTKIQHLPHRGNPIPVTLRRVAAHVVEPAAPGEHLRLRDSGTASGRPNANRPHPHRSASVLGVPARCPAPRQFNRQVEGLRNPPSERARRRLASLEPLELFRPILVCPPETSCFNRSVPMTDSPLSTNVRPISADTLLPGQPSFESAGMERIAASQVDHRLDCTAHGLLPLANR